MKNKKIIWVVGIILALILLNATNSLSNIKQNIPLIRCFDYDYIIEFKESDLPVRITFYILEDGKEELFKEDIANEQIKSTLLHCGHDYKAVYEFDGYEKFTDYVSIPEYNPVIKKTTRIELQ